MSIPNPKKRKDLYLSDSQYMDLLQKIKEVVNVENFEVYCYDSTTIGNKYTESNCGLCNDNFTTLETALFPKDFPERNDMKYHEEWHKCPFDTRPMSDEFRSGCFYTCYIFQTKKFDIELMKSMVDKTIEEAKKWKEERRLSERGD